MTGPSFNTGTLEYQEPISLAQYGAMAEFNRQSHEPQVSPLDEPPAKLEGLAEESLRRPSSETTPLISNRSQSQRLTLPEVDAPEPDTSCMTKCVLGAVALTAYAGVMTDKWFHPNVPFAYVFIAIGVPFGIHGALKFKAIQAASRADEPSQATPNHQNNSSSSSVNTESSPDQNAEVEAETELERLETGGCLPYRWSDSDLIGLLKY